LDEGIQGVMMMLRMATVLVMGLPFLQLGPLVKMNGSKMASCSLKDACYGERFVNWMVWVHLLKALRNDVLYARMEPSKECGIEIVYGDAM